MKRTTGITVLLLAVSMCSFGQTTEQVISLLYDIDTRKTNFDNEIIYMEEFNFGIPGGTNWLVEWRDRSMVEGSIRVSIIPMIYVVDIDIEEIKFRAQISLVSEGDVYHPRSYSERLPGVTRGNGMYQIGDFNGDGFDEVAEFTTGAPTPQFLICGYDPLESNIKWYCSIPFDYDYSLPPVEFIIYKRMKGFKLRYFTDEVAGGQGWVPDPSPKNGRWFFYIWDEGRRRFVEIEEVEEDGIESPWPVTAVQDTGKWIWTSADGFAVATEEEPSEEKPYFAVENESPNSPFDIRILHIIGVVTFAFVIILLAVFFVVKRKRRR